MKKFINRKAYSQKIDVWICPDHGVVDFNKKEASIVDGEPFCTKEENGKMCCKDVIILDTYKKCSRCGKLIFKTKAELSAEVQKILKKIRKKRRVKCPKKKQSR